MSNFRAGLEISQEVKKLNKTTGKIIKEIEKEP